MIPTSSIINHASSLSLLFISVFLWVNYAFKARARGLILTNIEHRKITLKKEREKNRERSRRE